MKKEEIVENISPISAVVRFNNGYNFKFNLEKFKDKSAGGISMTNPTDYVPFMTFAELFFDKVEDLTNSDWVDGDLDNSDCDDLESNSIFGVADKIIENSDKIKDISNILKQEQKPAPVDNPVELGQSASSKASEAKPATADGSPVQKQDQQQE